MILRLLDGLLLGVGPNNPGLWRRKRRRTLTVVAGRIVQTRGCSRGSGEGDRGNPQGSSQRYHRREGAIYLHFFPPYLMVLPRRVSARAPESLEAADELQP